MLLSLENITFSYGDRTIFHDVNLTINDKDRIGLIGVNGVGKSTFLNVIIGTLEGYTGDIHKKNGLRIGYLAQNGALDSTRTVYEEMRSVYSGLLQTLDKMHALEEEMARVAHGGEEYNRCVEEYARLSNIFETADGYNIDVRIKTVLSGMGFADSLDKDIAVMSGGEKTRLALAKLLLEEPDLLILDEPTNHLDFSTLMWLEKYLVAYKGAILIVSHDRYFLDKIVDNIWDMENGGILTYRGNYSKFKLLKKARIEHDVKEYERQQEKIKSMQEYIDKNIVRATTSKSAKSRVHQLENMEILEKPYIEKRVPSFRFDYDYESVKEVLKIENLDICIDDKRLVSDINLLMRRGEKLAIVGDNGTGKSTLLKTIIGEREEAHGTIKWGKNVRLAYYDQENQKLDYTNTIIDEYYSIYREKTFTEARSDLARMLLQGEDIYKKVSVLSGGERAKLCFAIMMAVRGNTLVFDEPTNHIDLQAREELESTLSAFTGSIICVSHDRYFINSICNKVLEIANGKVTLYNGTYDEYLEYKALEAERCEIEKENAVISKPIAKSTYKTQKIRREEAKLRAEFRDIENSIMELESRNDDILELMSSERDYRLINEYSEELEGNKSRLDTLYARWEELTELLN